MELWEAQLKALSCSNEQPIKYAVFFAIATIVALLIFTAAGRAALFFFIVVPTAVVLWLVIAMSRRNMNK